MYRQVNDTISEKHYQLSMKKIISTVLYVHIPVFRLFYGPYSSALPIPLYSMGIYPYILWNNWNDYFPYRPSQQTKATWRFSSIAFYLPRYFQTILLFIHFREKRAIKLTDVYHMTSSEPKTEPTIFDVFQPIFNCL